MTVPKLDEISIRKHIGEPSFSRGKQYFHGGAVFSAFRERNLLKAKCRGSSSSFYRIEAQLDKKGVDHASCSCPVGAGGHCKHVAAVLLTWIHHPKSFTVLEGIDKTLKKHSREELIVLIKQMIRREPDLEVLLETPLPGMKRTSKPINSKLFKDQAEAAFESESYDEWKGPSEIAYDLKKVFQMGSDFLKAKEYSSAVAVCQGLINAVIENYESVQDDEGDIGSVLQDCVENLGKCLKNERNQKTRDSVLRLLFQIFKFDLGLGGVGLSDEVPSILSKKYVTDDERKQVARWAQDFSSKKGPGSEWETEAMGGLILDLQGSKMGDDAYLKICRKTGRTLDLVERFLQLKRVQEAYEEAKKMGDYELLNSADSFLKHKQEQLIQGLILERSKTSKNTRLLEWLKNFSKSHRNYGEALAISKNLFRSHPSLEEYRELRKYAQSLNQWDTLQPELLAFLRSQKNKEVLIRIYLDEGDIDLALELANKEPVTHFHFGFAYSTSIQLEVAKKAEKARPQAAVEIYRKYGENYILGRNRGSYREGCRFLKKAKSIQHSLGQDTDWERYIDKLRTQFRNLPALQEEMKKASL